jgi:YD repeat-containing protein
MRPYSALKSILKGYCWEGACRVVSRPRRRLLFPRLRGKHGDKHGDRRDVFSFKFAYDAGDRLITITYPPAQSGGSSTTSTFTYDSRGRRTSATDQNGKTTSYAYDTADRLTTVTAAGNVTAYSYDTKNNLLGITDANSHTTNFTYDAFGRVTQTTFPSSFYESYDAANCD